MRFAVSAARTIRELRLSTKDMKKLFSTAAIIAALASAVPASAQRTGPGPTANTGTGPGVLPPGRLGPSSALQSEPGVWWPARCALYPQSLALARLLEVIALLDGAGRDPTFAELMLRTPEATDGQFRALIVRMRKARWLCSPQTPISWCT
jgi:hypothetical protein